MVRILTVADFGEDGLDEFRGRVDHVLAVVERQESLAALLECVRCLLGHAVVRIVARCRAPWRPRQAPPMDR